MFIVLAATAKDNKNDTYLKQNKYIEYIDVNIKVKTNPLPMQEMIPFQENLLLNNQYRPDLRRPYIRLISENGLIKYHVEETRSKIFENIKRNRIKLANLSAKPSKVLLTKIKVPLVLDRASLGLISTPNFSNYTLKQKSNSNTIPPRTGPPLKIQSWIKTRQLAKEEERSKSEVKPSHTYFSPV
jgi:hypothetical protein